MSKDTPYRMFKVGNLQLGLFMTQENTKMWTSRILERHRCHGKIVHSALIESLSVLVCEVLCDN